MIATSEKTQEHFGYLRETANSCCREDESAEIRLGTAGFTADGWPGSFYPKGTQPLDYLAYYATKFDSLEIRSTFYQIPRTETARSWALKTPRGFVFSLTAPRAVTHNNALQDCHDEFERFIDAAHSLGDKLGPIVLKFPHFKQFLSSEQFILRLDSFLNESTCNGCKFAIEIRNKDWLTPWFADRLREQNVALVLQDQWWMPRPEVLLKKFDPITADFVFICWQGDHKGIEKRTKLWNKTVFDRTAELRTWVDFCSKTQTRGIKQYISVDNQFAGNAPATLELFRSLCHEKGIATPRCLGE